MTHSVARSLWERETRSYARCSKEREEVSCWGRMTSLSAGMFSHWYRQGQARFSHQMVPINSVPGTGCMRPRLLPHIELTCQIPARCGGIPHRSPRVTRGFFESINLLLAKRSVKSNHNGALLQLQHRARRQEDHSCDSKKKMDS